MPRQGHRLSRLEPGPSVVMLDSSQSTISAPPSIRSPVFPRSAKLFALCDLSCCIHTCPPFDFLSSFQAVRASAATFLCFFAFQAPVAIRAQYSDV